MQRFGAEGIPGRVKSMCKGPGQNGAQHVCTIEGPMCEKYLGNYDGARKGGFSILALSAVEGKYPLVTQIISPKGFMVKRIR